MISTLAGIFVFLASVFIVSRKEYVPEPIDKLANFAIVQATRFNQTNHKDVQLSEYTTFVKSACVSCATRELAQKALRLQISSLPKYIIDEIIDMALPEGASIETARQNMSNTADETGRVSVFMYYINTVYDESEKNRYKTCVLVSGVWLVIGKVVVGQVTETAEVITGVKPCHCGYLYCEKCPVISQTVTQRPVYAMQTGTIEWHQGLHRMLANLAAEQVGGMRLKNQYELDEHISKGWDVHSHVASSDTTSKNTKLEN